VTSEQAKEILLRHRPGDETGDPEMAAALALCERDAALRAWFEEQGRTQSAIQECFRKITLPAGLKEQIISEHQAALRADWWRHPRVLAAAALVIMLAAVAVFWVQRGGNTADDPGIASFRMRMVKEALRLYRMDIETADLKQIRRHLASRQSPADFTLPDALDRASLTGCATTRWQGANVSLICFLKDKTNPAGVKSDLWLFVMDQSVVKDPPAPGELREAKVNRLFTVTWTQDGKVYLLGTEGGEAELRKWL
jgi:type II secretory pathway pseudopilin PulG